MLAFLEKYPTLYALIIAPLVLGFVGAVANAFTRKRTPEEYAAMPQRLAGFLRIMSALFPDPRKAVDAAQQIVNNVPPANPTRSLQPGESVPPPTPRNDGAGPNVASIVLAIAVGSVLASTPYALCSCSPAANRTAAAEAQVDYEVTSYTTEVTKCKIAARGSFDVCLAAAGDTKENRASCKTKSLSQFDGCACGVDAKYQHDAGGSCQ